MDIKSYEEFHELNEMARTPEQRKARRLAKKTSGSPVSKPEKSNPKTSMDSDDDIEDMEQLPVAPSKSMSQAVERYRTEMVKLQDLQKEFVLTSKDNVAKRESLKKKLVAQSKAARAAESDFEKIIAAEEEEFVEDMFFESLDITSILTESIDSSTIKEMDKAVKDSIMKKFLIAADDVIEVLYRDNDFDYEDILEFLAIKMEKMHPSD
jgi:hypothetical protein